MKKRLLVSGLFVLMFIIFGCTAQVSDTIQEQTPDSLQEQASEVAREQISEVQEQKSDSFTNETVPEEVIGEEGSFEDTRCSRTFSPKFSTGPYYNGPLFDAHFHVPVTFEHSTLGQNGPTGHAINSPSTRSTNYRDPILGVDVTVDEILCFFDKEDVRGAIGFYIPNPLDLDESIRAAKDIKQQSSNRINLFLMTGLLDAQSLDNIQNDNINLFKGYGELAFYSQEMAGYTPSSNKFLQIYGVADKHNLVVMIHPGASQKSDIEKALQNNPNVNFLLHGFEIENDVTALMDKYPNVYFSLDSATMYAMQGVFINGPKEEFVSRFKSEFNTLLDRNVNKWKKEVEKRPDRFMWGTDRGPDWHFDEDVSLLLEEFARAFIGKLVPTVQEKYAYRNAERLLQG